jgi:hypothetical protein
VNFVTVVDGPYPRSYGHLRPRHWPISRPLSRAIRSTLSTSKMPRVPAARLDRTLLRHSGVDEHHGARRREPPRNASGRDRADPMRSSNVADRAITSDASPTSVMVRPNRRAAARGSFGSSGGRPSEADATRPPERLTGAPAHADLHRCRDHIFKVLGRVLPPAMTAGSAPISRQP